MEQQLSAHQLRYERISGVDGAQALSQFTDGQRAHFYKCHGKHILAGELGCYLSHLNALRHFLNSDAGTAVILEDDAQLPENLDTLWAGLSQAGKEWDFLRLQSRRNYYKLPTGPINNTYSFYISFTRSTGSTAYAVNKKAASVLLEKLQSIEVPYDHAFDQPQYFGLKYRHLFPNIIGIADFNSTIETSSRDIISAFGKLKTLLWRGHAETGRFIWSLKEYAQAKLGLTLR